MSSDPKSTSRARFLPISRGRRAMGPPPATMPTPTSHCDRIAFSRLAKLMSHASVISLPFPVARPRMQAIDTNGARVKRTSTSGLRETLHHRGDVMEGIAELLRVRPRAVSEPGIIRCDQVIAIRQARQERFEHP